LEDVSYLFACLRRKILRCLSKQLWFLEKEKHGVPARGPIPHALSYLEGNRVSFFKLLHGDERLIVALNQLVGDMCNSSIADAVIQEVCVGSSYGIKERAVEGADELTPVLLVSWPVLKPHTKRKIVLGVLHILIIERFLHTQAYFMHIVTCLRYLGLILGKLYKVLSFRVCTIDWCFFEAVLGRVENF
jgi:hypothetical protein